MSVRGNNVYPGPVTETAPSTSFSSSLEPILEPESRNLYGKLEELSFQSIRYFIIFKLLEEKLKQTRPDLVAPLDILTSFCIQTHNLLFKYGITDTEKLKQLNIPVIDDFFANPSEISEEKRKEIITQFITEDVINQLIATSVSPNVLTLVDDEIKNFFLTKLLTLRLIVEELILLFEEPEVEISTLNAFVITPNPSKPGKYNAKLKAVQLLQGIESFHLDKQSKKREALASLNQICQEFGIVPNCQSLKLFTTKKPMLSFSFFRGKRQPKIETEIEGAIIMERDRVEIRYSHEYIETQRLPVFSGQGNTRDLFKKRFNSLLTQLNHLSFDLLQSMPVLSIVALKDFKGIDETRVVHTDYTNFIAGVSDVIVSDTQFFTQEQLNKYISLDVDDPEADELNRLAKEAKAKLFQDWLKSDKGKSEATRYGINTVRKYELFSDMNQKEIPTKFVKYQKNNPSADFFKFRDEYLLARLPHLQAHKAAAAAEQHTTNLPAINEAGGASGGARRRLRSRKRNGKKSQRGGVKRHTNKRKNIRGRVRKSNKPRRKKAKKLSKKLRKN